MTPAIDVHTHMLNRDWLELLRAHGRPRYELRKSLDAPEGIFLDGAPFMTPAGFGGLPGGAATAEPASASTANATSTPRLTNRLRRRSIAESQ